MATTNPEMGARAPGLRRDNREVLSARATVPGVRPDPPASHATSVSKHGTMRVIGAGGELAASFDRVKPDGRVNRSLGVQA